MYAAIDIGGTKTFAASLNNDGVISQIIRFETPQNYEQFLVELRAAYDQINAKEFKAGGVGLPATHMDREHGVGVSFGNLPWKNVPVQHDLEKLLGCPFVFDNDAKLAALSEAMLVKEKYDKVLYITVSTGIGLGLVVNQIIDTNFGDGGGRTMLVEHEGSLQSWESFASGKAIVARYGKMAKDIDDEATWKKIVRDLSVGFIELIALVQPEIIVIGGSVGTHFHKYGALLHAELLKYQTPMLTIPKLIGAQRPEEAVVYGAYDLAKQHYGHHTGDN